MKQSARTRNLALLGCVPLLGCLLVCVCLAALVTLPALSYRAREAALDRSLLLGMTRDQVHQELDRFGRHIVPPLPDQRCSDQYPEVAQIEFVDVAGPWLIMPGGFSLDMCYDESSKLV
jgi:hypothetical protein